MKSPNYYLAYSTDNAVASFYLDIIHFTRMCKLDPGVTDVRIYITINEVTPRRAEDEKRMVRIKRMIDSNPFFTCCIISYRRNQGRDFGALFHSLKHILSHAEAGDYIVCLNRSALGPFTALWYKRFVDQYKRHDEVGLCGNTINFSGWDECSLPGVTTHVQTYAFLTQAGRFMLLMDDFPGIHAASRGEAIVHGELALSRRMLAMHLKLTCLAWPDYVFDLGAPSSPHLPQGNIAHKVSGLPYRHIIRKDRMTARLKAPYYYWKNRFQEWGR